MCVKCVWFYEDLMYIEVKFKIQTFMRIKNIFLVSYIAITPQSPNFFFFFLYDIYVKCVWFYEDLLYIEVKFKIRTFRRIKNIFYSSILQSHLNLPIIFFLIRYLCEMCVVFMKIYGIFWVGEDSS